MGRAWVGFAINDQIPRVLTVQDVVDGGPADLAGIRNGDELSAFGGMPTHNRDQFKRAFQQCAVIGQPVRVSITRDIGMTTPAHKDLTLVVGDKDHNRDFVPAEELPPMRSAEDLRRILDDEHLLDVVSRAAFLEMDKDNSRLVSKRELKAVMREWLPAGRYASEEELNAWFRTADLDETGYLQRYEVKELMRKLLRWQLTHMPSSSHHASRSGPRMPPRTGVASGSTVTASVDDLRAILQDERSLQEVADFAFRQADRNHSGLVNYYEFKSAMSQWLGRDLVEELTDTDYSTMFNRYDTNWSGKLTPTEWKPLIRDVLNTIIILYQPVNVASVDDLRNILESDKRLTAAAKSAFRRADRNKSGLLNPQELHSAIQAWLGPTLGAPLTDTEFRNTFRAYDANNSGLLGITEFKPLLKDILQWLVSTHARGQGGSRGIGGSSGSSVYNLEDLRMVLDSPPLLDQVALKTFSQADWNHSGAVDMYELKVALNSWLGKDFAEELSDADYNAIFRKYDVDRSGTLQVHEWKPLIRDVINTIIVLYQPIDVATVADLKSVLAADKRFNAAAKAAFRQADTNRSGLLNFNETRIALQRWLGPTLGAPLTEYELSAMFDSYDRNRSGKLGYTEFKSLLRDVLKWLIDQHIQGAAVAPTRQQHRGLGGNSSSVGASPVYLDDIRRILDDSHMLDTVTNSTFRQADRDGNGSVDKYELKIALTDWLGPDFSEELTDQDFTAVFNRYDTNYSGRISRYEWKPLIRDVLNTIVVLYQPPNVATVEDLKPLLTNEKRFNAAAKANFRRADANRSGRLNYREIRDALQTWLGPSLGGPLTEQEIISMFTNYDTNHSGKIGYTEFRALLKDILKWLIDHHMKPASHTIPNHSSYLPPPLPPPPPAGRRTPPLMIYSISDLHKVLSDSSLLEDVSSYTFKQADRDNSGRVDKYELESALTQWLGRDFAEELTPTDYTAIFNRYDTNYSGRLSQYEWKPLIRDVINTIIVLYQPPDVATVDDLEALLANDKRMNAACKAAFRRADANRSGLLNPTEVSSAIQGWLGPTLGAPLTENEFVNMFNSYDTNRSGRLGYSEFRPLLRDVLRWLINRNRRRTPSPTRSHKVTTPSRQIWELKQIVENESKLLATTKECFLMADMNDSGYITLPDVIRGVRQWLGHAYQSEITDFEFARMFEHHDTLGNKRLSLREFRTLFRDCLNFVISANPQAPRLVTLDDLRQVLRDPAVMADISREMFDQADANHSGKISYSELVSALRGWLGTDLSDELTNEDFQDIFDTYDTNHSGLLNYNEFKPLIRDIINTLIVVYQPPDVANIDQLHTLLNDPRLLNASCTACFRAADRNRSGLVNRHEMTSAIKKWLGPLADRISGEDYSEIFHAYDINRSGKLSRAEFKPLVRQVIKTICKAAELYTSTGEDFMGMDVLTLKQSLKETQRLLFEERQTNRELREQIVELHKQLKYRDTPVTVTTTPAPIHVVERVEREPVIYVQNEQPPTVVRRYGAGTAVGAPVYAGRYCAPRAERIYAP